VVYIIDKGILVVEVDGMGAAEKDKKEKGGGLSYHLSIILNIIVVKIYISDITKLVDFGCLAYY